MRGEIEERRVRSWAELNEALFHGVWDEALGRHRGTVAFRGLSTADYRLETSLTRLGPHCEVVERHLLRNFAKYAHQDASPNPSRWHWLALAQHHGLPTRLLDWTHSPYVALHFATANWRRFDQDGVVWMVDYQRAHERLRGIELRIVPAEPHPAMTHLAPAPRSIDLSRVLEIEGGNTFTADLLHELGLDPIRLQELTDEPFLLFVEPPSLDSRIVNQFALFSVLSDPRLPLDTWLERHPGTGRKIIIPAELKWEVRDKLDQANITERVLFPGLDGLCTWLHRHYSPK